MLLTQLNLSVKAATTPSPGKFIPKSALETTDTEYGLCTGKTPQKVWFGKNGSNAQAWWIAGYDSTTQGLVLLCDPLQPMNDSQGFLAQDKYEQGDGTPATSNYYYNKTAYTTDWDCTYEDNFTPTGKVFANHYGGSDIRAVLKGYETDTSKFSTAEQDLMKETTVWTWDKKNDEYYSTRSKLYLGVGQYSWKNGYTEEDKQKHFFTVGANVVDTSKTGNDATNNGLKVGLVGDTGPEGSPYISKEKKFWLRSPEAGNEPNKSSTVLYAGTGYVVDHIGVQGSLRCVPAFALNLESVIFASAAAPAASSSSAFSDGVYLRFADDENRLDTTASTSGNTLTVARGSGNGDVYLYIQGNDDTNDWVYSTKITGAATLSANDIHNGLENLSDCKVWVETTKDNVTYAEEIEVSAATTQVKLEGSCPVHIALQDNMGRAITGTDAAGITLEIDATTLSEDTTNGIFKSASLPEGSYTLTVTVDEDSSKYIAPKVTKYTVKNGMDDLGNIKVTTIRLEQKVVEIGRVLSGVGGDAGY